MILSNIRNINQSETFFVIILNLDQWIRYCVKRSILAQVIIMFRRLALVEGLTRNAITNCMK